MASTEKAPAVAKRRTIAQLEAELAEARAELAGSRAERDEALEYQKATSNVLKVISRSTFNLQPVLDTLVEAAATLCNADMVLIAVRDGEVYRSAALFAHTPELDTLNRGRCYTIGRGTVI